MKRFNEAAGIPRGRPDLAMPATAPATCFNEAAGIPRGRRFPQIFSMVSLKYLLQ